MKTHKDPAVVNFRINRGLLLCKWVRNIIFEKFLKPKIVFLGGTYIFANAQNLSIN